MPSTVQERIYARVSLIFPLLVLALGIFWLSSGVIGLWQHQAVIAVLGPDVPSVFRWTTVVVGAFIDIAIGAAVLFRPLTRVASLLSIGVAGAYLLGGTLFAPHLWSDPLGPLVKVFPAMALALTVATLAEDR